MNFKHFYMLSNEVMISHKKCIILIKKFLSSLIFFLLKNIFTLNLISNQKQTKKRFLQKPGRNFSKTSGHPALDMYKTGHLLFLNSLKHIFDTFFVFRYEVYKYFINDNKCKEVNT